MGDERQAGGRILAGLRRPHLSWLPCAALTGFSGLWFLVNLARPTGPPLVAWAPAVAATALAALAGWTTGRGPGVTRAARRFWHQIALGTFLVGVGSVIRAVHALDGTTRRVEPPEMVVFLIAILVDGWAMLSLPLGLRRRGEWRTFFLDACTVLAAAALFLWQFSVRDALERGYDNRYALLAALMAMVLVLVAVFALVKVALTGKSTVDIGALRWLGLALVVGSVGSIPETMLPPSAPSISQVIVPVTCTLAIIAMGRQRRAAPGSPRPAVTRGRRRFSILPYLAVAASNALLLFTAVSGTRVDQIGVSIGVVVLAGLVIARQVLAFGDNARLLERLDAGMTELRDRERRFRSLVQNASDLITVTDAEGRLTYVSPGALRLLGLPAEDWIGRPAAELVHTGDIALVQEEYGRIAGTPGATATFHVRLVHANGSYRWTEIIMANLLDDPGIAGIVGNARDITEERDFKQRLSHQASHDSLTQLANRALFSERVDRALAAGPAEAIRVLLIDLNEFKTVNDTLGHAAGDVLLVAAANRLAGAVGPGDTVARLGGDEFAVLVCRTTDDEADRLVAAIAAAFADPVYVDGHRLAIAASIGIAAGTADTTPAELLRRADIAMYTSKADRDGPPTRFARYTASLDTAILGRAELEDELREAIDAGGLSLAYQPIIDLPGGATVAVEALVRWPHPRHGPLSPAQFMPLAERTGLIVSLGRWVLASAVHQAAAWRAEYGEHAPRLSVNVSPRELHAPDFLDRVANILAASGFPASWLTLEITESTALRDNSAETLYALRELGVRISLDDFGTGHSSLSLLQSCPVDEVKLDRTFTGTCTAARRGVAAALIEIARALDLAAVAEGVETAEQAEQLTRMGYRYAQGFHFAVPQPAEQIARLLDTTRTVDARR